jgi:SAM-dependent methyltransferase
MGSIAAHSPAILARPMSTELDDPSRIGDIRRTILSKPFLRRFYEEVYAHYAAALSRAPRDGIALELGSGGGFVKDVLPDVITSDTIAYDGVDRVVDATKMPFADGELRAILMMNVFHHIPDVEAFLHEAVRCLRPGGRVFIFDQHPGWISTPILSKAHHEPWRPDATEWQFASTGPLSGANGALAWIVFRRDRDRFERDFPQLRLERYEPGSPMRYWASGGLKKWSLLPGWAFGPATVVDRALTNLTPRLASFVEIELARI